MSIPSHLRVHDAPDAFRSRTVVANGLRFHVREHGDGDRLALCLHGFPECSYSWRYQMTMLADLGYRVWAPDLRGYGASERPERTADYAIDCLVADVAGLIDASGAREVLLIAHDWGGAIAWEFAMRKLRPLAGLVILNMPHTRLFQRAFRTPNRQWLRSWYILLFQLPRIPEWYLARSDYRAIRGAFRSMAVDKSSFPHEVLRVYRDQAARPGALRAMLAYYRAAIRHPSRDRVPATVDVPTLIVWGEQDKALGVELLEGTERFVRDLRIVRVPGASHWVQQEAPEAVNAALSGWLEHAR